MKDISFLYIAYNSGSTYENTYKTPVSLHRVNAHINAVTRSHAAAGDLIKNVWIIQGGYIKSLENIAAFNKRAFESLKSCPIKK